MCRHMNRTTRRHCWMHDFCSFKQNRKVEHYLLRHVTIAYGCYCPQSRKFCCYDCLFLTYGCIRSAFKKESVEELNDKIPAFRFIGLLLNNLLVLENGIANFTKDTCPCCTKVNAIVGVANDIEVDCEWDDSEIPSDDEPEPSPEDDVRQQPLTECVQVLNKRKLSEGPKRSSCNSNSKRQAKRRKKYNNFSSADNSGYDGALYIPCAQIALRFPPGLVSTHCLGKQAKAAHKGIGHAVTTPELDRILRTRFASRSEFNCVKKDTVLFREIILPFSVHTVRSFYEGNEDRFNGKARIIIYDEISNQPTYCRRDVVKESDFCKATMIDDTWLVGVDLLLICVHSLDHQADLFAVCITYSRNYMNINPFSKELFDDLIRRAGKKGIEAQRSGGSNGYFSMETSEDRRAYKLLTEKSAFSPRVCSSTYCIGVNSPSKSGLMVFYMSCKEVDLTAKKWMYSPPKIGGQQRLTDKQIKTHDLLTQLPDSRVVSAFLLEHYNTLESTKLKASAGVVRNVLEELYCACALATKFKQEKNRNVLKYNPFYWLAKENTLSLAAYPTAFHFDTFKGGDCDQMENKVVLIAPQRCSSKETLGLGRGGGGPGTFCFALLDHPAAIRVRRTNFITAFGAPPVGRIVTQRLITDYCAMYPVLGEIFNALQDAYHDRLLN